MRGTTIAAIAAAAGVGIAALIVMTYMPFSRTVAESDMPQPQNTTQPVQNDSATAGYRKVNVTINGVQLVADIAATSDQRSKGLAVRDSMAENESMLFYFPKANEYSFWMKGMKFPIDIIWLDTNRTVFHIEHSLEPCGPVDCPQYMPDGEAQYVLETVAGFSQKYNVTENTVVEFDPNQVR